jgi:formylglycine-generating enzyme required for sulfatase activity
MAVTIDAGWHPLVDSSPPDWASEWGQDRFGVYVAFRIGTATQRLRWIPPGRFWMGSPEDEEGRLDWEGPRHEVTLMEGFWLFDTPCTQALWEAVMGENPSRFVSPMRPVERVSFEDVQRFLERVNERVQGLSLELPSEAQWEYACRAGTETATYAGPMVIVGENNAPVLDSIAWYSGNSGVDFDLEDGEDSSGWDKKQYEHTKAGTRKVGLKKPNPWGLRDMLGNAWEWCADAWHNSHDGAPADGSARAGGGAADRVIRGGSWHGSAWYVCAAYRLRNDPTGRGGDVGFRCARVQSASTAGARSAGR